jgi:prolyl oligopeptidase
VNLPETLVVAGEYDSRVDPMHAKKFVAEVQNHPGQVSPFLLYMDFDSGHGTGKTQQQRVIDRDYELRFLIQATGRGQVTDDRAGVRADGGEITGNQ